MFWQNSELSWSYLLVRLSSSMWVICSKHRCKSHWVAFSWRQDWVVPNEVIFVKQTPHCWKKDHSKGNVEQNAEFWFFFSLAGVSSSSTWGPCKHHIDSSKVNIEKFLKTQKKPWKSLQNIKGNVDKMLSCVAFILCLEGRVVRRVRSEWTSAPPG